MAFKTDEDRMKLHIMEMEAENTRLHEVIRMQRRSLYDLVQNIREDIAEEEIGKHLAMAVNDAYEILERDNECS